MISDRGLRWEAARFQIGVPCEEVSSQQCELLSVSPSSAYYRPVSLPERDARLLAAIDRIHTDRPFLASRRIVDELLEVELSANRKRVQRLIRLMGIEAI